ncbi:MAG: FAD-binding protein [Oligoflexia bacterium]|nr:FAD-binding protein [Oligoflexia bacterium]
MKIQKNISLADKNWFKTGGAAAYYSTPQTSAEFTESILYAVSNQLPVFVLGEGANILISDDGYPGVVIHPKLKKIAIDNLDTRNIVTAEAGVTLQDLIDYLTANNYESIIYPTHQNRITSASNDLGNGLVEFSGIPGTIGGSVYINVHYFQYFLSNFLLSAELIAKENGKIFSVDENWFKFDYDDSRLQEKQHYLLRASFQLKKINDLESAYQRGRRDEIIRHRQQRYPTSNTCGSFFRNFKLEEIPFEIHGKKILNVAYYLDQLGIKGELSFGKARVSPQHANMLITSDGAISADIINLAQEMKKRLWDRFHLTPHLECQLIGFGDAPPI